MRTLIKDGLIYDGSGKEPYRSNIVIEKDRIIEISQNDNAAADIEINAELCAITPGFIDAHRHCDIAAITDSSFGDIELAQGITTTLSGNCGMTPFPIAEDTSRQLYDFIEPCLGRMPDDVKLFGFEDYINMLKAVRPYINIGGMIGTGAVRIAVKGFQKTPFTRNEMERAKGYLIEAMQAGAFGISSGIMYSPECYSTVEEFIEILKEPAKYDAILTCHIRGEGNSLVDSVEEILRIGREADIPLNISHFKATGIRNWNKSIHRAIDKIEAARESGQDVTVDFYPYLGGSTTIMSLIPPAVLADDLNSTLSLLSSPSGVDRLKKEIYREHNNWDNMVMSIGWNRIIISSVTKDHNKRFIGRNMKAITEELGYEDAVEFLCDLVADEQAKVGIIVMSMAQEDVDTVAGLPYAMVISDSLYGSPSHPHPRLYGSFAKIIRDYVMERKVLSLSGAIHKMTGMTAERYKIKGRGSITTGGYADINIFRPERLADNATFAEPKQICSGMDVVLINGEIVWKDGQRTGKSCAAVLSLR